MKILAIETSCDETAIAILENRDGKKNNFNLLSSIVLSQIKIHKPFGGVVPNLAQREHQKNLAPILVEALREARFLISKSKFPISKQVLNTKYKILNTILAREPELLANFKKHILPLDPRPLHLDAIAVTSGPGLEPALWVGINFTKALSEIWKTPIIPVNHLEGHIYANWLNKNKNNSGDKKNPEFPLLALIVSGGHTELVFMKKNMDYKILGETRDDAAGEAFDKVAKMLKLGYPGGPAISQLAAKWNSQFPISNFQKKSKTEFQNFKFPRPMINSPDLDFSFSGLKTSVLYYLRDNPNAEKSAIAAEFQQAVVDVLEAKTLKALKKYKVKSFVLGGGVAANHALRSTLDALIKKSFPSVSIHLSPLWLTGDNAAMIAAAAYFKVVKFGKKAYVDPAKLRAKGNLEL